MEDISITFNYLNLTDINGLLYPATAEYTFFQVHMRHCCCLVAKPCPTLCWTDPMVCSLPGSSVHGISQVRILVWVAISSSRGLPNPRIQPEAPKSPALAGRFFTAEPPGKPQRDPLGASYTLSHFSPTVVLLDAIRRSVCLLYLWRTSSGTSLAVQWLRLPTFTAGGGDSIPGGWTCMAKKKKKKERKKKKKITH